MKYLFTPLVLLLVASTEAFNVIKQARKSPSVHNCNNDISRRRALEGIFMPVVVTISTSFAQPAYADVTSKVASQSALRYVKRSMKELEKLEFFAAQNEYSEIKQGIRSPGLSEVRKNMQVLIRGGDDGPEANNLKITYENFIKSIEDLDGAASLGSRGRKGIEIYPRFEKSVKSLAAFEEVAARSVEIPMASVE